MEMATAAAGGKFVPTRCFKCHEGRPFVAGRDGPAKPLCAGCLVQYVGRVMRDTFIRSCCVPFAVRIGIAVSGGPSSMVMLQLVADIVRATAPQRGIFSFVVIHLDESGVLGANSDHCERMLRWTKQKAQECGFELASFRMMDDFHAMLPFEPSTFFAQLSLSNSEELFYLVKRRCLVEAAARCGCAAGGLIIGDTGNRIACRALSYIARGRGYNLGNACGFTGVAHYHNGSSTKLYRPMRGILAKEVVMFAKAQVIPSSFSFVPSTYSSSRSVDRTIEAFVNTLTCSSHRSIVFNILNSTAALHGAADEAIIAHHHGSCWLCGEEVEPDRLTSDTPPRSSLGGMLEAACHGCSALLVAIGLPMEALQRLHAWFTAAAGAPPTPVPPDTH